jgi:transposase
MDKDTTYVAIDDSKRTLVVGILRPGDHEPELREIPNEPKGVRRLVERLTREGAVRACYEAGVSGYDLYRQLTARGVACQVVAPALTPRRPGQRIKTDRRDAAKLVRLFRAGELTAIQVPDEAEEGVRDLLRCREAVRRDVLRWRHRVVTFLDRHGRRYLAGKNWTPRHWTWLRQQQFARPVLQRTLPAALFALEQALAHQAELDQAVAALAQEAPYLEPVGWLRCFRGLDTLSAMILVAEIVDFHRFQRPRELMAYLGLVPSESSSGGTERRGALTKTGNTHARRVLVEAA